MGWPAGLCFGVAEGRGMLQTPLACLAPCQGQGDPPEVSPLEVTALCQEWQQE